ncbi:AAA family ATPase [Pelagicoccus albus]|uniref:AAA family ATPase n=2 Tax=Pelagicoccus albus TaxID=415222 RepID=A0A7X1BBY4_9BACT|nr:AAA family ATPase [Pelagicoccus albus]
MPFGGPTGGPTGVASPGPESTPPPEEEDQERIEALKRIEAFNLKPREIRDYLDRYVIQQNEAKKVISVAICDHFNHIRRCLEKPEIADQDYAKQNIILLGPTGVGKTYLMRNVAKLVGVPFVKADATKFSETGYIGGDVEDLVRDLVKAANGDTELAQYGIVYIDEIDKIANKMNGNGGGRDVSGRGVQINLLKLMEDTEVNLQSQTDMMGQMQAMMDLQRGKKKKRSVSTKHILFIVSGAFDQMDGSIKKRLTNTSMGFGASQIDDDEGDANFLDKAETRDFIDYGFEPEFVGRLPVRVACQPLKPEDLFQIMTTSEGSVLRQYISDFEGYGISLEMDKESLQEIAERAYKEKTGARGLMTILERAFRGFKFELPSTNIKSLQVSRETIEDPQAQLKNMLHENLSDQSTLLKKEVHEYAARFEQQYGFKLDFTEDAIHALVEESLETDKTIRGLCERKFHDFNHGLTLINRNTDQTTFVIDETVIQDAEKALSNWVVASYRKEESEPQ